MDGGPGLGQALALLNNETALGRSVAAEPIWDTDTATNYFRWKNSSDSKLHELWYEDSRSFGRKCAEAKRLGARGIGIWLPENAATVQQAAEMWSVIPSFAHHEPKPSTELGTGSLKTDDAPHHPPQQRCTLTNRTDTAEQPYFEFAAASIAACCSYCASHSRCTFAEYSDSKQRCWLKDANTFTPGPNSSTTLLVVRAHPPLPPPPAPPAVTRARVALNGPAVASLPRFWKASVGSGHARLGLRADWRRQLAAVHRDIGITGVRFHGLFDDDMHVVTAAKDGSLVYNWTSVDKLWDGIMAAGVTAPIVELSYMPAAIANCSGAPAPPAELGGANNIRLSSESDSACHMTHYYQGIDTMPRKWELWFELVHAFGKHIVGRYGEAAVAKWRFEVWIEMKFGETYMRLFNASFQALKKVSQKLRVGGPATMELQSVRDFLDAQAKWGTAADFVSTHTYPTDSCNENPAKLDCFTDAIIGAKAQAAGTPFLITEYSCGWNNPQIHDGESFAYAASFALRTVNALRSAGLEAFSWWTFDMIFEENNPDTTHHLAAGDEFGRGTLGADASWQTVSGVPLPSYRAFQLLNDAGDELVPVSFGTGLSGNNSGSDGTLSIMATRHPQSSATEQIEQRARDEESNFLG